MKPDNLPPCPLCGHPALIPFDVAGNVYTHCSNDECDLLLHYIRVEQWRSRPGEQKLQHIITEYEEDRQRVFLEDCPGGFDELHCACVPALRDEIARLQNLLDAQTFGK